MSGPNWSEFENRRKAEPVVSQAADEAGDLCARIFTSLDGKDLLAFLRSITVDRRCRPGASEAELRELEAQRRLVDVLERLRDAGLERAKREVSK